MIKDIKRKLYYYINTVVLKKIININIKSIEETIEFIIDNKCSVSRFGDGELSIINGMDIAFQPQSKELSNKLKYILKSNDKGIIICLPGPLNNLDDLEDESKLFWKENLKTGRLSWIKNINLHKTYYNTQMTRPYMDFKDKDNAKIIFYKLKKIWENRDIVIIEGKESRLGVGNDLFKGAKSIQRIIAPSTNAFEKYQDILQEAKKIEKNKLLLIALGPTATILAYDLNRCNYQAIDIGHIDIEYEWFLRGENKKVKINNKYVNEVKNGEVVENIYDECYSKEIIKVID